jgi:hypothetical protein
MIVVSWKFQIVQAVVMLPAANDVGSPGGSSIPQTGFKLSTRYLGIWALLILEMKLKFDERSMN